MTNPNALMDNKGQIYYQNFDFEIFVEYPHFEVIDTKVLHTPNNQDEIIKKLRSWGFNEFLIYPIKRYDKKQSNQWLIRFKTEETFINFVKLYEGE